MTQNKELQTEPGVKLTIPAIAKDTKYSETEVTIAQTNNVGRGLTLAELAYFLKVCQTVNLNPFIKEIWAYKDKRGNLLVFAGRDGFLAKAQRDPRYAGIRSSEVREKDEFEINIPEGRVHHKITKTSSQRGKIIGGYALAFRKDGEATLEWVDYDTYYRGSGDPAKANAWNTHSAAMIKKVAETHALKLAFGISGLQVEYDYDIKNNIAIPINTEYEAQVREKTLLEKIEGCKTPNEVKALWDTTDPKERQEYKQIFLDRGYALGAIDKKTKKEPAKQEVKQSEEPKLPCADQIDPNRTNGKQVLTKDELQQYLDIISRGRFMDENGSPLTPGDWFQSIRARKAIRFEDYRTIQAAMNKYIIDDIVKKNKDEK